MTRWYFIDGKNKPTLASLFEKVVGAGTVSSIGRAFDLMEVAEREIKRAGGKRGNKMWNTFSLMMPGVLLDVSEKLYVAHVRELLDRVKKDQDTRPGTDAEMCVAFCNASLRAPLDGAHTKAYEEAFVRCFGQLPPGVDAPSGYVGYKGEMGEIQSGLRKRLAQSWRVVKEKE